MQTAFPRPMVIIMTAFTFVAFLPNEMQAYDLKRVIRDLNRDNSLKSAGDCLFL